MPRQLYTRSQAKAAAAPYAVPQAIAGGEETIQAALIARRNVCSLLDPRLPSAQELGSWLTVLGFLYAPGQAPSAIQNHG